jgi:hypothetical protein
MNEALLPRNEILFFLSFLAQKAHFDCRYVFEVKDCVFCSRLFVTVCLKASFGLTLQSSYIFTFVVYIVGMDSEREVALCFG